MSCIYKYKGKDYTKEEFYSLVSNSNFIQQEQVEKFTELQERLNNKEFLEGAKNAFESSEKLQNVYYEAAGVIQNTKTKKTGLLDYFLNIKKDSVFQELIQIGENIGIGIEEYESDSPLQANWSGKNVTINKTYGKVTSNVIAHEVVHGILHTLTNNDYKNSKLNLKLEKFKTELFDYIEKKGINNLNLPPELRILKLDYIKKMSNQEIVTYAFTDSQFSEFLASIKTDAKLSNNESFWNKLINIFNTALKELGFTSKLDELIDILNTEVPLFNNTQPTSQQKQQALNAYTDYIARVSLGIVKNPTSGEYNYESQVKDIVYHNTDEQFDKFRDVPIAKFFTKSPVGGRKYRMPILLNMTNPKVFNDFTEDDEMTYGLVEMYAKNKEKDGIINGTEGETRTEYIVSQPEQIHILGSKQDIEGFKEFVESQKEIEPEIVEKIEGPFLQNPFPDSDTIKAIKELNIDKESLEQILEGVNANLEQMSILNTSEDINNLIRELRKVLPEAYFHISENFQFEGSDFSVLRLINPNDQIKEAATIDPEQVLTESANEYNVFIANSTFFSTLESPPSENSTFLNNLMIDLLKDMGVEVLDKKENKEAVEKAFEELYRDLTITPGGRDRIFAFTKLIDRQNRSFLGTVVLNDEFNTINLYEEAGHLLIYYLDKLSNIDPTIAAQLDIDLFWKKPTDPNNTDYLAQTQEYKAHFQLEYEKMLAMLTQKVSKLDEFKQIIDADPNAYTLETRNHIDALIDEAYNSGLLNSLTKEDPASRDLALKTYAETLARIEIAGRILGNGLLYAANKRLIKPKPKNFFEKYVFDNIEKLIQKIGDWIGKFFAKKSNTLAKIRALELTKPNDPYTLALYDIADKIWEDKSNIKNYFRTYTNTAKGQQHYGPGPSIEASDSSMRVDITKHYLETFSLEEKTELDSFFDQMDPIIEKEIEAYNKNIDDYTNSNKQFERSQALLTAYQNNGSVMINGISVPMPQEVFSFFYTLTPLQLDIIDKKLKEVFTTNYNQLKAIAVTNNDNTIQTELANTSKALVAALNALISPDLNSYSGDPSLKLELETFTKSKEFFYSLTPLNNVTHGDLLNTFVSQALIASASTKDFNDAKIGMENTINYLFGIFEDKNYSQESFYNQHQKPYDRFIMQNQQLLDIGKRRQEVLKAISRHDKDKVLRWLFIGIPYRDINGNLKRIPSLFNEFKYTYDYLNEYREYLSVLSNRLVIAEASGRQDLIDIARTNLQNARMSSKEFIYNYGKLNYFKEILDNVYSENGIVTEEVAANFILPEDREDFREVTADFANKVKEIEAILNAENQDFFVEKLADYYQQEHPGITIDDQILQELKNIVDQSVEELSWFTYQTGKEFNNNELWSRIIGNVARLNRKVTVETNEKMFSVNSVWASVKEKLKANPIIKKHLGKTRSGNVEELFHGKKPDGSRSHYIINAYNTHDFNENYQKDLLGIYEEINNYLERTNQKFRFPLDNSEISEQRRRQVLHPNYYPDNITQKDYDTIRKMYQRLKLQHDLTYWQAKPISERTKIIQEKELELGGRNSSAFKRWRNSVEKVYKVPTPGKKNSYDEVTYYLGELANPATRTAPQKITAIFLEQDPNGKWIKIKTDLDLKAVNFKDKDFEELITVPEFKRAYEEMIEVQNDAYKLFLGNNRYNYVDALQTWSFENEFGDTIGRVNSAKGVKNFFGKIKTIISSIFQIQDTDKSWFDNAKKKIVPVRGRIKLDEGKEDLLLDNYISILREGYQSALNYRLKKEQQSEMEVLRTLLKGRAALEREQRMVRVREEESRNPATNIVDSVYKTLRRQIVSWKSKNNYWENFIDNHIDSIYYGSTYNTPNKFSVFLLNVGKIATWYQLAGQIFPAEAAFFQSNINLAKIQASGRIATPLPGKGYNKLSLQKLFNIIKKYFSLTKDSTLEYATGVMNSKESLFMEFIGVRNTSREAMQYSNSLLRTTGDFLGFGYLSVANTPGNRFLINQVLNNYKWIDEAKMFMNPGMYSEWYKNKNGRFLNIEDIEKNGQVIKGINSIFEGIPQELSFYEMVEKKQDQNGTYYLEIKQEHKDKVTPYVRSMAGQLVNSLAHTIDMSVGNPPVTMRNPVVAALFSLKRWLFVAMHNLAHSRYDQDRQEYIKGTYQTLLELFRTQYLYLSSNLISKLPSLLFQAIRGNLSPIEKAKIDFAKVQMESNYDYNVRAALKELNIILHISFGSILANGALAAWAVKECYDEDKESWSCWLALNLNILNTRILAETTGVIDVFQWLLNFDKPLPAFNQVQNWFDMFTEGFVDLFETATLLIPNALGLTDEKTKKAKTGIYKDMGGFQKNVYNFLPQYRGFFNTMDSDALLQRARYQNSLVNRGINLPKALMHFGPGPIASPYLVNKMMEYFIIDDPRLKTTSYEPFMKIRKTEVSE